MKYLPAEYIHALPFALEEAGKNPALLQTFSPERASRRTKKN